MIRGGCLAAALVALAARAPAGDAAYREGDRLMDQEGDEEALAVWQTILEGDPDDIEALLRAGIALSMLDRTDESAARFDRGLALKPREPRLLYNRALLRLKLDDLDGARRQLEELLQVCTWYPNAHYHLGVICEKRGDLDAARECYIRELNVNPSSAMAWQKHMDLREPPDAGPGWVVWVLIAVALAGAVVTGALMRHQRWEKPSDA